jgi:hypothetical protein
MVHLLLMSRQPRYRFLRVLSSIDGWPEEQGVVV